jgi:hypothetical protein
VCRAIVYVDDECCGVWSSVIREVWPAAMVRLDALHAMRRLTSTTSSTQHPWHGFFCATLSDAIFTYDRSELARLRKACLDIYGKQPSQDQIRKHVPRVIVNPMGIVEAIECVLEHFSQQRHARSGKLLTIATQTAWNNLKSHIVSGCLCDPPGLVMNTHVDEEDVVIGGEKFHTLRSVRGSSALEGFHAHQKQWFGVFGHHSFDAGLALAAEGTMRWCRKHCQDPNRACNVPCVFSGGLLHEINNLHVQLTGHKLYQSLSYVSAPPLAFTCLSKANQQNARRHQDQFLNCIDELRDKLRRLEHERAVQVDDWKPQNHSPIIGTRNLQPARMLSPTIVESSLPKVVSAPSPVVNAASQAGAKRTSSEEGPAEQSNPCSKANSAIRQTKCRKCGMVGTRCRRFEWIQWCEASDPPFDDWKSTIYPSLKAASRAASSKRAARATGVRGRPPKRLRAD